MTTAKKILGTAFGEEESKLYVDDVFSTYLYTGNGGTQTINNGIDLAGEGGLVWFKNRDTAGYNHALYSGTDGKSYYPPLASNNADAGSYNGANITASSTGFSFNHSWGSINESGNRIVAWTFRRAPKFFDVVTYMGDGNSNRPIPHNLSITPGMVITKRIDGISSWEVYHRYQGVTWAGGLSLSETKANDWWESSSNYTSTTFSPRSTNNVPGAQYVAYLFAHDPSADGFIQCGSFTLDGSNPTTVTLGWEPQFLLIKATSVTGNWVMLDNIRTLNLQGIRYLLANTTTAETNSAWVVSPTATGFTVGPTTAGTYIYLAIRRPNKPPKSGAEVFFAQNGAGESNGTATSNRYTSNFPVDFLIQGYKNGTANSQVTVNRLCGDKFQRTTGTVAENVWTGLKWDDMDGIYTNSVSADNTLVGWMFKRAPGFFDVVCYTGTGVAGYAGSHNLGVAPEMIITKVRNSASDWDVLFDFKVAEYSHAALNSTNARLVWNYGTFLLDQRPSATEFLPRGGTTLNYSSNNIIAYLFATLPGISKVGAYTGNGTTQTINCGFSTGARFILIKRTNSTGDWYVWDTARGIVAANDPHLSLNTTAAEVTTDDSVDPHASGFIVNQVAATNINVSNGQYIFLAIA